MDAPRKAWRLRAGVGAVIVAAGAAGGALWASEASGATGYRTGMTTTASVERTLDVSGNVEPAQQSVAAFQVAGTVSTVDVKMGQRVTAGQTLASLDSSSLSENVTAAQTALSAAQATLAENEAGESTGGTGGGSNATLSVAVLSAGVPSGGAGSNAAALSQDQQAVTTAQSTLDAATEKLGVDIGIAQGDLTTVGTACNTPTTTPTTTPTAPTTTTPTTTPTSTPATTTAFVSASQSPSTCEADITTATHAENTVLRDQNAVADDQRMLATAEKSLVTLLTSMAASGPHSSSSPSSSPSSPTHGSTSPFSGAGKGSQNAGSQNAGSGLSRGTGGSGTRASGNFGSSGSASKGSGSGSSGAGATATATNSAEQLASDQAAIDSDQATLIQDQEALAAAKLTSPISGTVAAVNLAVGQSVTARSTSDTITVINAGSYQATASLTSDQVPEVKVGDRAQVSVDGSSATYNGTVSRVGPVDTSSSSGDTYPVVVAMDPGPGIAAGSGASLELDVAGANHTVVVPTSAVHVIAAKNAYVMAIESGKEVRQRVTVGVVGDVYTQVTSGVKPGTKVVLADMSEAVPSSSSNSSIRSLLGGGGGAFTFRVGGGGGGLGRGAGLGGGLKG